MKCWVYREVYAVCDGCGYDANALGLDVPADNRHDAIACARTAGWRTVKGRFLCPECQKRAALAAAEGAGA